MMEEGRDPFLTEKAVVLRMLSRVLREIPSQEELTVLADPELYEALPFGGEQETGRRGARILKEWASSYREETADQIRQDGMRLFVGPGRVQAPPWESVYRSREHLLFQQETWEVRQWYHRYGLAFRQEKKEPDDHIALELEFLAVLTERMSEAEKEGNSKRYRELAKDRKEFLTEHPMKWCAFWQELVEERAQSDFYRGIACLARAVLTALAES